jgi:ATP-dependent Clp endopeptidase proteolytic subunit ClpP
MDAMQRSMRRLTNLVQQPKSSWYRVIRNDAGGPTRVDIYDEIGGSWLFGGVSAVDFVAELAGIVGDLEVHINSPGGDVFDGLAIYNSLAQRPGNVTTVIDGLAASAASFIAQAGKTRVVAPGAMLMIHDAAGVCMGNANDMRELAGLLDKVSDNLASIYARHSGQADGWRDAMRTETWYTADEALAAGLVDRVAERPADDALAAMARFDLSAYEHAPRLAAAATPAAGHGPFTGTHTHRHATGDDQGDDATHEHEHTHDGDADHDHDHPTGHTGGPVLGVETMPLEAKALPVHHTAVVHTKWDGPAAVAAMPQDAAVLKYCHAWQSADSAAAPHGDGDGLKRDYKFPHHATEGGAANLNACRNGLARLDGANIPDADRAGVRSHLQAHLNDGAHDGGHDAGHDGGAHDHAAPFPAWLNDEPAPFPAWLQ